MNHQIKINRAFRAAKVFQGARTRAAIEAAIPEAALSSFTSRQLTIMIEALDAHWHKAQHEAEANILSEGCIWDQRQLKLREIAD